MNSIIFWSIIIAINVMNLIAIILNLLARR